MTGGTPVGVLVIGAGPAGLAAAEAALDAGARVTLLDASDATGGQYWRHLPEERAGEHEARLHHGFARYERLRDRVVGDAACTVLLGSAVWSVERSAAAGSGFTVNVATGRVDAARAAMSALEPEAIVLATGAHDRTLPFPGWELPGVFTGGAAQALAKGERVRVGERVVVAGAGPFLLPVAESVAESGARVIEVVEANRLGRIVRGWAPKPWRLLGARAKVGELVGYVSGFLRHRIPYRMGAAVVAAHGTDRVEAVTIARLDTDWRPIPGTERRVAVDAVCVSHDFTPRLELAIAAGCALDERRFVVVDDSQETTVPHVFAAGEITGIGGVDLAMAEGAVAGAAAAGRTPSRNAVRRRRVFSDFAGRISAAHGIRSGWHHWLHDDTIVCRCEEVGYGRLCSTAASTDAEGLRSLKLSTRAGLGICQGRICGRTVEELLVAASPGDRFLDSVSTDRRPIVAPQRLGDLASLGDGPESP
ncbi:FAD-dependent oxidoreductase [Labedella phragmitis]|uniref:FAD-dependent oxidoreductase n=1 Tax=Labedella phragmitis TaxID=2498849 RepID=UPI001AA09F4D|nr:FAD-dependent oxidoreductase [Labedella phragmitis]